MEDENPLLRELDEIYDSLRTEISTVDSKFRKPSRELFDRYLNHLRGQGKFSKINSFERLYCTSFHEYREDQPDEIDSHVQARPFTYSDLQIPHPKQNQPVKGIKVFKKAGPGFKPCDYPMGKSPELYALEDQLLLECEVSNQMNETPMDPSSHTTTKIYTLTRNIKGCLIADSFMRKLNTVQLRDLLADIRVYNGKFPYGFSMESSRPNP